MKYKYTRALKNTLLIALLSFTLSACGESSTSSTNSSGGGSGACSSHGGVSCSAGPDSDGSVICVDGWRDSSVSYSSVKKCN